RGIAFDGEAQYNVDGSGRFFGVGPDSSRAAQTNFQRSTLQYNWRFGVPIFKGSGVKFNVAHHLAGEKISAGPISSLPSIDQRFPQQTPAHFHQDGELQLFMDYDTRDDIVTTRRGLYAKALLENSQRAWGSEFAFQRYQVDLRAFHPTGSSGRFVSAGRVLFEHLVGSAPFYLMPSLGGKYTHRGYGDGRYIDNALLTASYEERITLYKIPLAGVTTEFEVDPYFELGSVDSSPHRFASRYARPVVGAAVRAIARPQVVGSIDMGYGQEGAAVFMDINYSY
ncbi:MAG: BamA/TamA family outer membrane protein, partial [Elusimicrobia bacterium]|nr:BamA/TamA family outer membrane protein [Elusimicrobiota bacterium]